MHRYRARMCRENGDRAVMDSECAWAHSVTRSHSKLLKSMVVVATSPVPQPAHDIETLLCNHHVMHCDEYVITSHRALALCLARSVCLSLSASLSLSRSPTLALSCSLSWNPNAHACTEKFGPSRQRSRCARVLEVMSVHKMHQLIIHFSAYSSSSYRRGLRWDATH